MKISTRIKGLSTLLMIMNYPLIAVADSGNSGSIGDVAQTLMGPTEIITKLVLVACYIIGIALLLVAVAQYRIHLQSPKLVPLTTPIALVILGVVALLIPYVTNKFETGNASKQNVQAAPPNLLPTPDISNTKGPALPPPTYNTSPDQNAQPQQPTQPTAPAPQPPMGGGNWTDDPKYNR